MGNIRELQIKTKKDSNGVVVVLLKGMIDSYAYGQLKGFFEDLFEKKTYKFIVDLSQVDYISSSGASVFIGVFGVIQDNDGKMILVNPKPVVSRLFELLGLNHIFTIVKDIPDARDKII